MSIKARLESEMKQALRARDAARLSCLRMLKSKLQEREVALRATRGLDYSIGDDEALGVISSYAKQRLDSIDGYRRGGRAELAAAEEAELAIVREYLPRQLGPDEIREIVRAAIAESGAAGARDVGAVMRLVMPRLKGLADGKLVQDVVRELLPGS